jgi:hypothetical protein
MSYCLLVFDACGVPHSGRLSRKAGWMSGYVQKEEYCAGLHLSSCVSNCIRWVHAFTDPQCLIYNCRLGSWGQGGACSCTDLWKNEIAEMEWLKARCEICLKAFPTCLEKMVMKDSCINNHVVLFQLKKEIYFPYVELVKAWVPCG